MTKLSHSSVSRYLKCPESYKLHYVKKLRPTVTSAALAFGSALDEAFNSLLLKDGKDPFEVFLARWENGWINKTLVDLPMSTQIVYANSDFDADLFKPSDIEKMNQAALHLGLSKEANSEHPLALYEECVTYKKQSAHRHFRKEENQYLNYCNWLCMIRKAELIIPAYKEQVVPKIKRIISVQKTLELLNENGDSVTGVIDIIAEWEDGNIYVLDNKSSSRLYDEDAVETSEQLALYGLSENINKAGFIVYLKAIQKNKKKICSKCNYDGSGGKHKTCANEINGKRCGGEWTETVYPKAVIQILLGDVNPNMENMVLDNFNVINNLIKQGVFFKNTNSCKSWYGGDCPYLNFCMKNKTDNLEIVE